MTPQPIELPKPSKSAEDINQLTFSLNVKPWMNNFAENLPTIRVGNNLAKLHNTQHGKPALIVGAGPSIANVKLSTLAAFNGVILTSDAMLKPLLKQHVKPYAVVSVDGHEKISAYYVKLPKGNKHGINAFLAATVHSSVTSLVTARGFPVYWFIPLLDNPLNNWFSPTRAMHYMSGDKYIHQCPGNVGATAWNLAAFLGCDPLILIGFDYGYSADTPIQNTMYYATFLKMNNGDYAKTKDFYRVERNPQGQEYLTDPVWDMYREQFLTLAKACPCRTINASDAGSLYGEGIQASTLREVIGVAK